MLFCLTIIFFSCDVAGQLSYCSNAKTSTGIRTLSLNEMACAELDPGNVIPDLGKKYMVCTASGKVQYFNCDGNERFSMARKNCTKTLISDCDLKLVDFNLPASYCNASFCKLPDCFCYGQVPSAVGYFDMPMFIMVSFDGPVTKLLYDKYFRPLVVDNVFRLHNPNGCRPKMAIFLTYTNSDPRKVEDIWKAGNEIACHSVHHTGTNDIDTMYEEYYDVINRLNNDTDNIDLAKSFKGFRSPNLYSTTDELFRFLQSEEYRFLYDSSILNINVMLGKTPLWPYTLDFVAEECINTPCPTLSHPGLWEVPINNWMGDNKDGCSMVDACIVGKSKSFSDATIDNWIDLFNRNFQNYYFPVKVPMGFFLHGEMFTRYPDSYRAMTAWFLSLRAKYRDVWIVTPSQVVEWMKRPLSHDEMIAKKWGC